jgi:hypothetical protein
LELASHSFPRDPALLDVAGNFKKKKNPDQEKK